MASHLKPDSSNKPDQGVSVDPSIAQQESNKKEKDEFESKLETIKDYYKQLTQKTISKEEKKEIDGRNNGLMMKDRLKKDELKKNELMMQNNQMEKFKTLKDMKEFIDLPQTTIQPKVTIKNTCISKGENYCAFWSPSNDLISIYRIPSLQLYSLVYVDRDKYELKDMERKLKGSHIPTDSLPECLNENTLNDPICAVAFLSSSFFIAVIQKRKISVFNFKDSAFDKVVIDPAKMPIHGPSDSKLFKDTVSRDAFADTDQKEKKSTSTIEGGAKDNYDSQLGAETNLLSPDKSRDRPRPDKSITIGDPKQSMFNVKIAKMIDISHARVENMEEPFDFNVQPQVKETRHITKDPEVGEEELKEQLEENKPEASEKVKEQKVVRFMMSDDLDKDIKSERGKSSRKLLMLKLLVGWYTEKGTELYIFDFHIETDKDKYRYAECKTYSVKKLNDVVQSENSYVFKNGGRWCLTELDTDAHYIIFKDHRIRIFYEKDQFKQQALIREDSESKKYPCESKVSFDVNKFNSSALPTTKIPIYYDDLDKIGVVDLIKKQVSIYDNIKEDRNAITDIDVSRDGDYLAIMKRADSSSYAGSVLGNFSVKNQSYRAHQGTFKGSTKFSHSYNADGTNYTSVIQIYRSPTNNREAILYREIKTIATNLEKMIFDRNTCYVYSSSYCTSFSLSLGINKLRLESELEGMGSREEESISMKMINPSRFVYSDSESVFVKDLDGFLKGVEVETDIKIYELTGIEKEKLAIIGLQAIKGSNKFWVIFGDKNSERLKVKSFNLKPKFLDCYKCGYMDSQPNDHLLKDDNPEKSNQETKTYDSTKNEASQEGPVYNKLEIVIDLDITESEEATQQAATNKYNKQQQSELDGKQLNQRDYVEISDDGKYIVWQEGEHIKGFSFFKKSTSSDKEQKTILTQKEDEAKKAEEEEEDNHDGKDPDGGEEVGEENNNADEDKKNDFDINPQYGSNTDDKKHGLQITKYAKNPSKKESGGSSFYQTFYSHHLSKNYYTKIEIIPSKNEFKIEVYDITEAGKRYIVSDTFTMTNVSQALLSEYKRDKTQEYNKAAIFEVTHFSKTIKDKTTNHLSVVELGCMYMLDINPDSNKITASNQCKFDKLYTVLLKAPISDKETTFRLDKVKVTANRLLTVMAVSLATPQSEYVLLLEKKYKDTDYSYKGSDISSKVGDFEFINFIEIKKGSIMGLEMATAPEDLNTKFPSSNTKSDSVKEQQSADQGPQQKPEKGTKYPISSKGITTEAKSNEAKSNIVTLDYLVFVTEDKELHIYEMLKALTRDTIPIPMIRIEVPTVKNSILLKLSVSKNLKKIILGYMSNELENVNFTTVNITDALSAEKTFLQVMLWYLQLCQDSGISAGERADKLRYLSRLISNFEPLQLKADPTYTLFVFAINDKELMKAYIDKCVNLEILCKSHCIWNLVLSQGSDCIDSVKVFVDKYIEYVDTNKSHPYVAADLLSKSIIEQKYWGNAPYSDLFKKLIFSPIDFGKTGQLVSQNRCVFYLAQDEYEKVTKEEGNSKLFKKLENKSKPLLKETPNDIKTYDFYKTALPLDLGIGTNFSQKFFSHIKNMSNDQLSDELFLSLIEYKAEMIKVFSYTHSILLLLLTLMVYVYFSIHKQELFYPILALNSFFVFYEFKCLISDVSHYISEPWNPVDLTMIFLCFWTVIHSSRDLEESDNKYYRWLKLTTMVAFAMRGVRTFKVLRYTNFIVIKLFKVFMGLIPLLVIFFYAIVSFSFVWMYTINFTPYPVDPVKLYDSLLIYTNIVFGDFDNSELSGFQFSVMTVGNVIINLTMANFLIALVSDTYSKIEERKQIYIVRDRLDFILDIDAFMRHMWCGSRKHMYFSMIQEPDKQYTVEYFDDELQKVITNFEERDKDYRDWESRVINKLKRKNDEITMKLNSIFKEHTKET